MLLNRLAVNDPARANHTRMSGGRYNAVSGLNPGDTADAFYRDTVQSGCGINDHALARFSNGIRNVPSTRSSARSSELKPDPSFATFIRIFNNPNSATAPITAAGNANLSLISRFTVKYQAGKVKDLHKGLQDLDKQIDAQNAQAGGGGPP